MEPLSISSSALVLIGLIAAPSAAQEPRPSTPPGQQPGKPSQTTPPSQTPPGSTLSLQRSDQLIGTPLSDKRGQRIGTFEDFVIGPDGRIGYAVVQTSRDGQMTLIPVPWSSFELSRRPGMETALLVVPRFESDRLKEAPSFPANRWPTEPSPTVFTEADAFFAQGLHAPPTGQPREAGAPIGMEMMTWRGTRLRNQPITDIQGNPIGTLNQVVYDPGSGRINYVVLSLGDGSDARVIAVPWEVLKGAKKDGKDVLQIAVPVERLRTAPQFQGGEQAWKQMSDPQWVNQMYTFYSVRPYWTTPSREMDERPKPPGGEEKPKPDGGEERPKPPGR